MIVLVTAANSHLGSMLVKGLVEEGHEVHAGVKDPATDREELAATWPNVKIFPIRFPEASPADTTAAPKKGEMDLEVLDGDIRRALKDVDWVFHSAGIHSLDLHTDTMLTICRACNQTPSVKKVVITSPLFTIGNRSSALDNTELTEDDWNSSASVAKHTTGLVAKYLDAGLSAEKAIWEFMKTKVTDDKFSLSVMHGGNVVGPVCLRKHAKGSIHFAMTRRILVGVNSGIQHHLHLVDIRDCVTAWIRAAEYKEAANKRFILVANTMSSKEVTEVLRKEFQPLGFNSISTSTMPNWLCRYVLAPIYTFMPTVSYMFSRAGKDVSFDTSRSREILKIQYREVEKSLIEGTHSMIEHGVIDKSTMPKKRDDCVKKFKWALDC